jgi:hypothetical protein
VAQSQEWSVTAVNAGEISKCRREVVSNRNCIYHFNIWSEEIELEKPDPERAATSSIFDAMRNGGEPWGGTDQECR